MIHLWKLWFIDKDKNKKNAKKAMKSQERLTYTSQVK